MYTDYGFIDYTGEIIYGPDDKLHRDIVPHPEKFNTYLAIRNKCVRWGITRKDKAAIFELITYDTTPIRNLYNVLKDKGKPASIFLDNATYIIDIYTSKSDDTLKYLSFEDKAGIMNYLRRYL
jgi:hypothetical protein